MTESRTLSTAITGRYLVEPASQASGVDAPLLVGFHGYGQNAERLLQELRRIPGASGWTLVAVQALHRFYNAKTQEEDPGSGGVLDDEPGPGAGHRGQPGLYGSRGCRAAD